MKKLENSSMSTTNAVDSRMLTGNKRLRGRYNASSRRIKHLTMLE